MLLSPTPPRMRSGPRLIPVVGSILAHAVFFAWLFAAPRDRGRSAYAQLIQPAETHLIWYNFKRKLPDVSPRSATGQNRPLRAEIVAPQSVVSSPPDAPRAPQMIFHPVPALKPEPVTALPNLIALSAPPPPQRQFTAPKRLEVKRSTTEVVPLARVPELTAKVDAAKLPELPPVARPFTPPPPLVPKLQMKVQTLDAPPVQPSGAGRTTFTAKVLDQGSRTLAFRPQPQRSFTASVGAMPDAPAVQGASPSSANVAVIGLNPIDKLNVPLPEDSRRAQFSGGPRLHPDGALSAGKSSGVAIPDVTIRGGDKDAAANLIAQTMSPAYNSPSSVEAMRASARDATRHRGSASDSPVAARQANGTRVSGAPDPRFLGRQVFSVAIQSPNLTSHVGSWLMWYADRTERAYEAQISAPEPLHKVDPKYVATAIEERIEGTIRLAFVISADGHVYAIETVKGIDDRLNQSAKEALKKWEFTPAMRDGKAIAVDALVEIPFRLAPATPN